METTIVNTPCGKVIGEVTEYGAKFQGIPYAKAKRFEKPTEITQFDGDIDATKQGVCCPQMRAFWNEEHRFYYKEFRVGQTFTYSEDCQILNIFQPKDAKNCPVLIYIHGGSFTGGSINETHFDGSAYTKRGVICVTINYRLNIFGSFADMEHSKGNLHIMDQCAAINWVIHNIESFGGDPNSITLMGQSAGAMSIQTLICTDALKGKIKGAIMLSGGGIRRVLLPITKPNPGYWKRLIKETGAKDYDEFYKMDTETVWTPWRTTHYLGKAAETKIVVDGDLVKNKKYITDVPVIYGICKKDLFPPLLRHMARDFSRKQKRKGCDAYIFELNRLLPPDDASFHTCDVWYALGSLGLSWRPFEQHDYDLSNEMVDRFSAFCRTCNPNVNGYPEWKKYNSKKDEYIFE